MLDFLSTDDEVVAEMLNLLSPDEDRWNARFAFPVAAAPF